MWAGHFKHVRGTILKGSPMQKWTFMQPLKSPFRTHQITNLPLCSIIPTAAPRQPNMVNLGYLPKNLISSWLGMVWSLTTKNKSTQVSNNLWPSKLRSNPRPLIFFGIIIPGPDGQLDAMDALETKHVLKWALCPPLISSWMVNMWVADKITFYPQWTWPKWAYRLWRFVLPSYVWK